MNDSSSTPNEAPKEVAPDAGAATPMAPAGHPSNGLAIASLVTGILALLTGFIIIGFALGIAAIILGAIGLRKPGGKGMSIAGIVTGALGLLTSLVFGIFLLFGLLASGAFLSQISSEVDNYNNEQQALLDAKKDFVRGETAIFGDFEVKANGVQRDYQPEGELFAAADGKELVVVNLSVKNLSDETQTFSSFSVQLQADGVGYSTSIASVDPDLSSITISPNSTTNGNLVFEVERGAQDLRIQYLDYAIDQGEGIKTLTFTLAL